MLKHLYKRMLGKHFGDDWSKALSIFKEMNLLEGSLMVVYVLHFCGCVPVLWALPKTPHPFPPTQGSILDASQRMVLMVIFFFFFF